jgi:hypothetical protein
MNDEIPPQLVPGNYDLFYTFIIGEMKNGNAIFERRAVLFFVLPARVDEEYHSNQYTQ